MRVILFLLVLFIILLSTTLNFNFSQGISFWFLTPHRPAENQNPFTLLAPAALPQNQPFDKEVYLPLVSKTEAATPIWHPQPRVSWQWD